MNEIESATGHSGMYRISVSVIYMYMYRHERDSITGQDQAGDRPA